MSLKKVVIFPGSLEEYERFRGYMCEVIDTGRPDKGVTLSVTYDVHERHKESSLALPEKVISHLVHSGIEAIVHAQESSRGDVGMILCSDKCHSYYGLPVRNATKPKGEPSLGGPA